MDLQIKIKNATKLKKGDILIYTGNKKVPNEYEPFNLEEFKQGILNELDTKTKQVNLAIKSNQVILDKIDKRNKEFINVFKGGK